MYILVRKINTVAINGEIVTYQVIDGISWWDAIFFVDAFYKQLHCKDNLSSILHWIWIEPELEVNWTWIGTSTSLHRKRNEIKAWFNDECFITKKVFRVFPVTPSYLLWISKLCVTGKLFSCHITVTRLCMCDRSVTGKICFCHA